MKTEKAIGRRAASTWGRLGSPFEKRQAAKAVRRHGRKLTRGAA